MRIRKSAALFGAYCESYIPGREVGDYIREMRRGYWKLVFSKNAFLVRIQDKAHALKESPKRFPEIKMLLLSFFLALVLFLTGEDWKPSDILDDVPIFQFTAYVDSMGGESKSAFLWGIALSVGMGTYIVNALQKYLIGQQTSSIFSIRGLLFWIMALYILALCSAVIQPLQNWYALHAPKPSPTSLMPHFPTAIFGLMAAFAIFYTFSETVKNMMAVYLGVPCFYIFTGLRLHYVVLFIFCGFDYLAGTDFFSDTVKVLCIALAFFSQAVVDFLYWIGGGYFIGISAELEAVRFILGMNRFCGYGAFSFKPM